MQTYVNDLGNYKIVKQIPIFKHRKMFTYLRIWLANAQNKSFYNRRFQLVRLLLDIKMHFCEKTFQRFDLKTPGCELQNPDTLMHYQLTKLD